VISTRKLRSASAIAGSVIAILIGLPSGVSAAPLQYLTGAGTKATPVVALTWAMLIVAVSVIVIISALVIAGYVRRPRLSLQPGEQSDVGSPQTGLNWIFIGVGISCVALLATVVWTVLVLADVETPGIRPAVTLEITGRQWFWEVRYLSPNPAQIFTTANEIHIPAGEPVRLKLIGGDVIHSFWVPQLAGKMDAIPGQTNETWFEAAAPGVYRGQCTEYCGVQHAHMGIMVIADAPAKFRKWWERQLLSPTQGPSDGAQLFEAHCGGCHTVRGTDAAGTKGPDLSHFMTRSTIAAGFLPNNGPNLARWVSDPQSVKPGSLMPTPEISGADLKSVDAYLQTLH
jgi:cytochrome c oxidase subunit 2